MTQSLLDSLFLAFRTKLVLMCSHVGSQELCARTMTMEDAHRVEIMLQSRAPNGDSKFYSTASGTLRDSHGIHAYYVNGHVTHWKPGVSWGTHT